MMTWRKIKVSWNKEYKNLNYKFIPTYQIKSSFEKYQHKEYQSFIGNDAYFLPNPMPSFVDKILNLDIFYNYKIKSPGFHKIRPGMGLPLHIDDYESFSEFYNIKNKNSIIRFIIFLEDSKPGHMLQIENKVYSSWYAGNYVSWQGDTPHGAFNLGTEDRYTLQITCHE